MPLGIGISIYSRVEGGGGPLPVIKLDFGKAVPSMYLALILEDF
jgi:hypothetical protein